MSDPHAQSPAALAGLERLDLSLLGGPSSSSRGASLSPNGYSSAASAPSPSSLLPKRRRSRMARRAQRSNQSRRSGSDGDNGSAADEDDGEDDLIILLHSPSLDPLPSPSLLSTSAGAGGLGLGIAADAETTPADDGQELTLTPVAGAELRVQPATPTESV